MFSITDFELNSHLWRKFTKFTKNPHRIGLILTNRIRRNPCEFSYEFVWILPKCCESHMASINWDAMMYFGSFHAELTLTSASAFEIDTHPLQIMTTWLAIGLLSTIISVGLAIISLHKAFIRNYSNGI